jgi:hypothetical protein
MRALSPLLHRLGISRNGARHSGPRKATQSFALIKRLTTLLCLGLIIGLAQAQPSGPVVVIVNPNNAVATPKPDQIANLFLGKTDTLPGSSVLIPVDQPEDSGLRRQFYKAVANRDSAQIKAYWARIMFTGRAQAPRMLANDAEVKKLVAENAGAIGYIQKSSVDDSVRILAQY